jgi:serine/threonine-protein kinase PknK
LNSPAPRALAGDVAGALASVDSLIASGAISHDRPLLAWRAFAWVAECRAASGAAPAARHAREQALALLEEMALELPPQQRALFWSDPQKQRIKASGESQRRRTETAVVSDEKETHMKTGRLLELIRRLALELDMNRLLERITDAAVEISGAERGFVLTVGAAGKLETHTVRTAGDAEHDPHVLFSQSIAEAVLIDGEPIITVDARSDSRVTEFLSVHKLSLKSVACLPIRGRAGVVGVLYLEHRVRRGRFEEADMGLLFAFADQAAIAIENAKQFAERAARQSELERVNRALEEAMRELERTVDARTSELETAHQELSRVKRELGSASGMHGIVGRSAPMRRVFSLVDRVAPTHVPVVIFGESGTGKELVARAIHDASPRAQRPFVAINCGSVPESLIESELFGHVRGAFTGADRDRPGVFVQASGGTLFLDEIGDMPPKMQVDLLRVLQEGKVRPVGSQAEIAVDVRVVCASNQALGALVEAKRFREDLFYRLNVVQIDLPPLRERKEDIALLADHLLEKVAKRTGTPLRRLDRSALERLVAASLPGNVRQLEHALTGAAVLASGDTIRADDLSLEGLSPATRPGVRAPSSAGTSVAPPPIGQRSQVR